MKRPTVLAAILAGAAAPVWAQAQASAEFWRLVAITLPLPPALADQGTAVFWNPAQPLVADRGAIALDLVQTPQTIGATGVLASGRVAVRPLGTLGLVLARIGIADLVRTTVSPDPSGESIPVYTQRAAAVWASSFGRTAVGLAAGAYNTRLDTAQETAFTADAGASYRFGDRLRLAASTHVTALSGPASSRDVYAGADLQAWSATLWHSVPGTLRVRAGATFGNGTGSDQQAGIAFDAGPMVGLDALVTRQETYGHTVWRGAGGLRLALGRYRVGFALDGGANAVGMSYRVGLEARL